MRIEVPFTAGDHAVIATYQHTGFDGRWYHTWSYRAAEAIPGVALTRAIPGVALTRAIPGVALTRAINAEGDALFGSGGLVHVRLAGEVPPP